MKMNYFVFGTNDMRAAEEFYDALLADAGPAKVQPTPRMTYWIGDDFAFALATPFDGQHATIGNGTMVGFSLGSAEAVRRLHARALTLGGQDEGKPAQRGPKFSSYVRDLDGNKICLSD